MRDRERLDNGVSELSTSHEIRSEMARIRAALNDDVEDAVAGAREMTDWKHQVGKHPWLSIAAAAAIGYLVVPKRVRVMRPDEDTLAALAKSQRLVVAPPAQAPPPSGPLSPFVRLIVGAATRGAVMAATRYASNLFSGGQHDPGSATRH